MNSLLLTLLFSAALSATVSYDVYTASNGSPNDVLHYTSTDDGILSFEGRYDSGGAGQTFNEIDALGGQGALQVTPNGRYLVVPNAGTNSITVFARNAGATSGHLRRIGTFDSGRPSGILSSLAVTDNHVYALYGNPFPSQPSWIQTFSLSHGQLELVDSFALPLALDHTSTGRDIVSVNPMQISISPGLLTISAKSVDGGHAGALLLVTLSGGLPDNCRTVIIDHDPNILKGFLRTGDTVFVTDAAENLIQTVNFDGLDVLTQSSQSSLGTAPCWIARSGNYVYVANTLSGDITGFALNEEETEITPIMGFTPVPFPFVGDLYTIGNLMFALSPNTGNVAAYKVYNDGRVIETSVTDAPDFLNAFPAGASTLNGTPFGLVAVSNYDVPSSESYFSGLEFADSEFSGVESSTCDEFCYQSQVRFTVEQLLANHAHNVDERDYERAVSVFCEDGEFRFGTALVSGAENLQGLFDTVIGDVAGSRLAQTNFAYINQTPDRVTVKDTFTLSQGAFGGFATALQGAYYDTFVRQESGQWCLRTRWANFDDVANVPGAV